MSNKPITIGLAGKGKITYSNLADNLDDHLDVTDDGDLAREVTCVIPMAKETQGDTQDHVLHYLEDLGIPYIVVTDGTATRDQRPILRNADEDDSLDEVDDLSNGVISRLVAAKQAGEETVLILAWGEKDPTPDDLSERLLDDAIQNEIVVLDLTNGLVDIGFKNDDPEEDDSDNDPEPPAKTARRKTPAKAAEPVEEPEVTSEPADTAEFLRRLRTALDRAQEVYGALAALRALAGSEKYDEDSADVQELLATIDAMEIEIGKAKEKAALVAAFKPEPKSRSQARRQQIVEEDKETDKPARRRVSNPEPEDDDAPAKAQHGKPRAAKRPAGETVKVIERPDGSLAKLGRGRPPAVGTETSRGIVREISKEQFDALDFS